ncbi:type IX secretion system membrane protein PorP/SprF [candidate division KSB1 bacterium]|nr:type IX secretion system membrane protein PorP/SprF [candidate division KSB1 bacterium]
MKLNRPKTFILVTISILVAVGPLKAQHWIDSNPADVFDCRSSLINPAVIALQPWHVSLGVKMLHVGFLEQDKFGLRANYFNITSPFLLDREWVIGINGQQFGIAMYQQSHIQAQTAYRLLESLSVGASWQIFYQSYQQDQFQLGDANDPLFANGVQSLAHSVGVGLLFQPRYDLRIGVGMSNLTEPNLSLVGGDARLPYRLDVGISYMRGSFAAGITLLDQETLGGMLDYKINDRGILRFGYTSDGIEFEGRLSVADRMQMFYTYDYPTNEFQDFSIGSHQVGLVFAFGDERPIINYKAAPPVEDALLQVDASVKQIEVQRICSEERVDEKLNKREWRHLTTALKTEINKPVAPESQTRYIVFIGGSKDSTEILTAAYQQSLQKVGQHVIDPANGIAEILMRDSTKVADELLEAIPTARIRREKLPMPGKNDQKLTNQSNESYKCNPDRIEFRIKGRRGRAKSWHLIIQDDKGLGIQWFDGIGRIPSRIVWELDKPIMEKLRPGVYSYQFTWTYDNKNIQRSAKGQLVIVTRHQRTSIDFSTEPAVMTPELQQEAQSLPAVRHAKRQ